MVSFSLLANIECFKELLHVFQLDVHVEAEIEKEVHKYFYLGLQL
jgi:hypothetical protein